MKGMEAQPNALYSSGRRLSLCGPRDQDPEPLPVVCWFSARFQILHRIFMLLEDASNSSTSRLLHSLVLQWGETAGSRYLRACILGQLTIIQGAKLSTLSRLTMGGAYNTLHLAHATRPCQGYPGTTPITTTNKTKEREVEKSMLGFGYRSF